jgi:His/Glu/Gln/Arg/opine family amino acid ABC transporter permease subunit
MDVFLAQLPRFIDASWLTLWMFVIVSIISTILGALLAIAAGVAGRWLSGPMAVYSWVFRGLPELVVLLACYLALPMLGFDLGSVGAALLGFTLIGTAFLYEIARTGLAAIDPDLLQAARALGMGWSLTMRRVILPQAIRVVVTPWATFLAGYVKAFALASAISVAEVMMITRQTMAISTQPFFLILLAGGIYAAMASALMLLEYGLKRYLDRRYGTVGRA